jgi:hypothetical protein
MAAPKPKNATAKPTLLDNVVILSSSLVSAA